MVGCKPLFLVRFVLFAFISVFSADMVTAQFAGGDGSETAPFQVETVEQLQEIQDHLEAYFIQTSDIDASSTETWNDGKGFVPLGDENIPFAGTYDGDGFVITGLFINREEQDNTGLFGMTTEAGLRNIALSGVRVTGASQTGGIAGVVKGGLFMNCSSEGEVAGHRMVGGLIGESTVNVESSSAEGSVTGQINVGGLIGMNRGNVYASSSEGVVTGGSQAGGLIGSNIGDVADSYSKSTVTGWGSVGGLIGININGEVGTGGHVTNSYAEGNVRGIDYEIGGLIGNNGGEVVESYATGAVIGEFPEAEEPVHDVGGLIGSNRGEIIKSYAEGNVTGYGTSVGGLIGSNASNITGSYARGEVFGWSDVGGLVGINLGIIKSSEADGSVTAEASRSGGLVGEHRSGGIRESFAKGDVSGENIVGGLAGLSSADIEASYARGSATGVGEVGGLAGVNSESGEILESFATGEVTAEESSGGFIGNNEGLVISSYWDTESSRQPEATGSGLPGGALGLLTEQMTGLTAADYMAGFNFDDIWLLTEGYPALYWEDVETELFAENDQPDLPAEITLKQNYPNPFNPSTTIEFGILTDGEVRLEVYDLLGRRVSVMVNEYKRSGWHQVNFDGEGLSSGVYLYRLQAAGKEESKTFTLVK